MHHNDRLFMSRSVTCLSKSSMLAIAGACLLPATASQAQENSPYYLGATLSATSNSNIYQTKAAQHDTITSAGLRVGVDQNFSRQHLLVNLGANSNRFATYKNNDYTDYDLKGQLDWATIERLSGTLNIGSRQERYVDAAQAISDANLLRTNNFGFKAKLGDVTALTFEAGFSASQSRYSSSLYKNYNKDQQAVNLGVRLRPMGGISIWSGVRHTNGRYPDYFSGPDKVSRNDLDLGTDARLTGASSLNARVSLSRESHSALQTRDYSSWTGALGWTWQPTGKLKLALNLNRDSSIGATDYAVNQIAFDSNDSRITNRLSLKADWEITSTVYLTASRSESYRALDYSRTNTAINASGKDTTAITSLGLNYAPLRTVELGCTYTLTDRSVSDGTPAGLSFPYSQKVVGCYGQVQVQ